MTLEAPTYNDILQKKHENNKPIPNQTSPQTARIFVENRLNNKTRKRIAQEMGVSLQKIDYHINKANRLLCSVLKGVLS